MADTLLFDPTSEFEVLETIEYEEEIQRPEELRFFTLDEQLLDYQSKVLSQKKKLTKFEIKKVYNEVDRFKEIYSKTIVFTEDEKGLGYEVDIGRKEINVPWVVPIYSKFAYTPYSYAENWMPLMDKLQSKNPNYYDRMIKALPKPYSTTEKDGVPINEKTVLIDEEGKHTIQALGNYVRSKGVVHEDGSFSLVDLPIGNTTDDIHTKGYYLKNRGVDIPKPIPEHKFLASVNPSKIITNDKLIDIFPSVQTILNNAIPTTIDPYGEGLKYLKIYDVKLNQIPWNTWKERFPPVDPITQTPNILSISFPSGGSEFVPPENVQKQYSSVWDEGVYPRLWLMKQEDGGQLISKMYLSKVGLAGNVPPEALAEILETKFPESTSDECFNTDNFENFLQSGVYRAPKWKDLSNAVDKDKPTPLGVCIPADYIQNERKKLISAGKKVWRETTSAELLKEYIELLKRFQGVQEPVVVETYEKFTSKPDSELYHDVTHILEDQTRTNDDKADAIQILINPIMPTNKVYLDKDDSFIVCSHTLAILRGELEDNRLMFYENWTAIDDGSRVCKYCGESVNKDVLIAQDDFDSQGNAIINYEKIESQITHGEHNISSFSASRDQLKKLFDLNNAGESVLFLLLSLLQVLPDEGSLLPVLQHIRKLSAILKVNKNIEKKAKDKVEGILGIIGMVILLQTHNPFLIPQRTYGIKVFKLTGFPRDTDETEDSPVLDNVIFVLRAFFEEFPNTLKGPVTEVLRAIIGRPKDVRKEAIRYLLNAKKEFGVAFESAKARYVAPISEEEHISISIPILHPKKTEYNPNEKFGNEELMMNCTVPRPQTIMINRYPPKVTQDKLELNKNIRLSKYAKEIAAKPINIPKIRFSDEDIRSKLSVGLPKFLKTDKLEKFLKMSNVDGVSIVTMIGRILDILSENKFSIKSIQQYRDTIEHLDTSISASLLRDVTKGILYELIQEVSKDKNKIGLGKAIDDALNHDVVMNMLLLTKDDAERIAQAARTKEKEKFKSIMRNLTDREREATKILQDIGIAPYIITNEDRELFAREYNYPDPEEEYNEILSRIDGDRPEDGYNDTRDYIENGDLPLNEYGDEMQADYGGYGDRAVRPYDDYANTVGDFDGDYGI